MPLLYWFKRRRRSRRAGSPSGAHVGAAAGALSSAPSAKSRPRPLAPTSEKDRPESVDNPELAQQFDQRSKEACSCEYALFKVSLPPSTPSHVDALHPVRGAAPRADPYPLVVPLPGQRRPLLCRQVVRSLPFCRSPVCQGLTLYPSLRAASTPASWAKSPSASSTARLSLASSSTFGRRPSLRLATSACCSSSLKVRCRRPLGELKHVLTRCARRRPVDPARHALCLPSAGHGRSSHRHWRTYPPLARNLQRWIWLPAARVVRRRRRPQLNLARDDFHRPPQCWRRPRARKDADRHGPCCRCRL